MTAMFVNLPVTDLERAKAFYTAIGCTLNPQFTDHNAACFVVEEDHSYFMLLTREYFQTFTDLPLGNPAVSPAVSTAIFLESREAVDSTASAGLAAGGTEPRPASDYGFMYQRGGHRSRAETPSSSAGWTPPPPPRVPRPSWRSRPEVDGRPRLRAVVRDHAGPGASWGERWALPIVRDLLVGPRQWRAGRGLPRYAQQHPGGAAQGAAGGWRHPPGAALTRHRL